MRIVVLDGHTLNPGDLSWDALKALGDCTIHDRTSPEQLLEHSRDADILLTNKTPIGAAVIAALPALRYIGVLATGYNIVDVAAAQSRKIIVANVPAYSTRSVAQMTFALLLELTHHVGALDQTVHAGRWSKSVDFCYWDYPLIELDGLTMGIVGFGAIGNAVAELARAFGMRVLVHSRTERPGAGISFVDMETLFHSADVISLHIPFTPATGQLVNCTRLAWMKRSAFLINTARGALVDEAALAAALNEGRIAGAGLDVLSAEPPNAANPLLEAKNCIIAPHIGWATKSARSRLMQTAVENVRRFIANKPVNVVSKS